MPSSHYAFFELVVTGIVWMTREHFNEVKWQNSTSPMWRADSSELMLSAVRGSKHKHNLIWPILNQQICKIYMPDRLCNLYSWLWCLDIWHLLYTAAVKKSVICTLHLRKCSLVFQDLSKIQSILTCHAKFMQNSPEVSSF